MSSVHGPIPKRYGILLVRCLPIKTSRQNLIGITLISGVLSASAKPWATFCQGMKNNGRLFVQGCKFIDGLLSECTKIIGGLFPHIPFMCNPEWHLFRVGLSHPVVKDTKDLEDFQLWRHCSGLEGDKHSIN